MEISVETLKRSIGDLPDTELLKRWEKQLFTDDALPIAANEIQRRGLDTSQDALSEIHRQDAVLANDYRTHQRKRVWRGVLKIAFILLAFAASVVGASFMAAALR